MLRIGFEHTLLRQQVTGGRIVGVLVSITCLLLLLSSALVAQENGAQAAQPEPVAKLVTELRDSPDAAVATDRARKLRDLKVPGTKALVALVRDRGLPVHVLRGVLTIFVLDNHRAEPFLEAFFGEIAATATGERREVFVDALRQFDVKGTMFTDLRRRVAAQEHGQARAAMLTALALLANTPAELKDVIGDVIGVLEKESDKGAARSLSKMLNRISLQEALKQVAEWRGWYDDFSKRHPAGFTVWDLHKEATARTARTARNESQEQKLRQKIDALARLAIQDCVRHGDLPSRYLDPKTFSAQVRDFAAESLAQAFRKTKIPEIKERAVTDLLTTLTQDPEKSVRAAALRSLAGVAGELGPKSQLSATIKDGIEPLLVPEQSADDLVLAVKVAQGIRNPGLAPALGKLYAAFRKKEGPGSALVRASVVDALSVLRKSDGLLVSDGTIRGALGDPDPKVQRKALSALAAGKKLENAEAIARHIQKIEDYSLRLDFLNHLKNMGRYDSAKVIAALLPLADRDQKEVQIQAVKGLLTGLAEHGARLPSAAQVRALLIKIFPDGIKQEALRDELVKVLDERKSPALRDITASWCRQAKGEARRKTLCRLLADVAKDDPRLLLDTGRALSLAGFTAEAEQLLRAARATVEKKPDAGARALRREVRADLAALLARKGGQPQLTAARTLLTEAIKENEADAALFAQRGQILRKLKDNAAAASDFEKVLVLTEGGDPKALRPGSARMLAEIKVGASSWDEALKALRKIPAGVWSQRFHFLAARSHLGLRHWAQAVHEADTALVKKGSVPARDIKRILVRSAFKARNGRVRERAAGLFAGMAADFPEEERQGLQAIKDKDGVLKNLVKQMDGALDKDLQGVRERIIQHGPESGIWLVHDMSTVAKGPSAARRLRRRIETLARLFPEDKEKHLALPKKGAPADQLSAFADRIASWWRARQPQ